MTDLYKLKKAPKGSPKKWQIKVETPSGGEKTVSFGARGYEDYTQHKDKSRRENYRQRHQHDNIDDPTSPGFWSWHVLWGDSTDIKKNLSAAKKKYRLNPGTPSMSKNQVTMKPRSKAELDAIRVSHKSKEHYSPRGNPEESYWGPEEYEVQAAYEREADLDFELPPPFESPYESNVERTSRGYVGKVYDSGKLIGRTSVFADPEEAWAAVSWKEYYLVSDPPRRNPEWAKRLGRDTHRAGMKAREYARKARAYADESYEDFKTGYREERAARGNPAKRFPRSTSIQSLIFDKDFFSKSQSKRWAAQHDFVSTGVDTKENTYRIRQQDPGEFSRGTFRTIELSEGVQAVIGMPKKGALG